MFNRGLTTCNGISNGALTNTVYSVTAGLTSSLIGMFTIIKPCLPVVPSTPCYQYFQSHPPQANPPSPAVPLHCDLQPGEGEQNLLHRRLKLLQQRLHGEIKRDIKSKTQNCLKKKIWLPYSKWKQLFHPFQSRKSNNCGYIYFYKQDTLNIYSHIFKGIPYWVC